MFVCVRAAYNNIWQTDLCRQAWRVVGGRTAAPPRTRESTGGHRDDDDDYDGASYHYSAHIAATILYIRRRMYNIMYRCNLLVTQPHTRILVRYTCTASLRQLTHTHTFTNVHELARALYTELHCVPLTRAQTIHILHSLTCSHTHTHIYANTLAQFYLPNSHYTQHTRTLQTYPHTLHCITCLPINTELRAVTRIARVHHVL